jgi:DNA-directed RNA polymerase subunit RPC12/RpoP
MIKSTPTKDITNQIEWAVLDDNALSISKCVCGKTFDYNFWIETDKSYPNKCPSCDRKMFFTVKITVYEATE